MEMKIANKNRIVVILSDDEKAALKVLAANDGRSMSGYLRLLLRLEISDSGDYA